MSFVKGKSGNPSGRAVGSTPGAKLKKAIIDNIPEILETLIQQAKDGDVQAAKVLVDKVIPGVKPQAMTIKVAKAKTLDKAGQNIVDATLNGDISPDTASTLMTALLNQAKLIETLELTKRIEALESNAK